MENLSGHNIKGYKLLERLGAGGFGVVYKAHQSTVGREVAFKIILPGFANQPEFIRRFETEAQVIARLEHPYITPLYDYWRDPDGAYLIMRWLRGGSLQQALQNGAFDLPSSLLLMEQISSALATAHRNHIVHRDLKPANILLDEDGNAYLADFGIAKDLSAIQMAATQADAIVGSPDYLAPEQARSESVTPQTDIYSLGVILYEVLTGIHPFPNLSTVERLYKHLNEPLPLIENLPPAIANPVNDVIQKATAKNPVQRYVDVLEFITSFRLAITVPTQQSFENIVEILTRREQEILQLIVEGLSNKEIAQELFLALATVKWYVTQIYSKLHVRSRVQAIVRARELNLIVSPYTTDEHPVTIEGMSSDSMQFRVENPYKGLLAFQSSDHMDFFGREKVVQKLIKRLQATDEANRFLALVGPSGSGKSSLLKAGLVPALWHGDLQGSEKWFVVEMVPGAHPLDELEIALVRVAANQASNLREQLARDERGLVRAANLILPQDDSDLVVIIDQFEEVFTLLDDEATRTQFLALVVSAVTDPRSRVRIIITLRADFYDRPLHYPQLGELVHSRMETLLPLSAQELERAINKPAERVGVRFEEGLVASIVSEINYQPGALPLLQYALTELFEQREGRVLTQAAYQQIGGSVGALAKRVDQLYTELNREGQELAQQIFLRLVTLGEGVEDTRRRVTRSELLGLSSNSDLADEIIDTFAEYRLLSLDNDPSTRRPIVEVAHEAILREWERLRGWLNANREDIRFQRQLAAQAAEWNAAGQESSFLLRGTRLDTFEKWVSESALSLTEAERDFLKASVAERVQQAETEAERQAHELRLERRSQTLLRGLVAVLLLATLGAFSFTGVAVSAAKRAEAQTRVAQSRELVQYAKDNLETDGELSTLLALEAVNLTYTMDGTVLPEAEVTLHQAVQAFHQPLRQSSALGCGGLVFSPDSTRIAYGLKCGDVFGEPGVMGIADTTTGQLLYQLPGDRDQISDPGQIIIIVPTGDTVELQIWDTSSRDHATLLSKVTEPSALWRSEDGTFAIQANWISASRNLQYLFASMAADGQNRIWDLTTGQEVVTAATQKLPKGNGLPTFSPDGSRLANLNPDGTLSILDTSNWEEIIHLSLPNTTIPNNVQFGFSENGELIITGNTDHTVTVWDAANGSALYTFNPAIMPDFVAINDDGTRVAVAAHSGQVVIWNGATQKEELAFGTSDGLNGIAFSSDGKRMATHHGSERLQIWDLVPAREVLTLINNDSDEDMAAVGLAYSPDGQRLIATGTGAIPNVWDVLTGEKLLPLIGHSARVRATAWSADGTLLATGSDDTTAIIWDAVTGERKFALSGHTDTVFALAFSPDSSRLVTSGLDGSLRIWDVKTGELRLTLTEKGVKESRGVAWSPDGWHIANTTFGFDAQQGAHLYIRNALTGQIEQDIALGDVGLVGNLVYSPDGTRLAAAAAWAQFYYVWDVNSGETVLTIPGHGFNTSTITFSPDGSQIATGGLDGLAQLWDSATGKELLTLNVPTGNTYRIAFSPDGTRLAIQSEDSTTRIYFVHIEDLIALAQSRLTRWWTQEECQKYLHTDTCPAE